MAEESSTETVKSLYSLSTPDAEEEENIPEPATTAADTSGMDFSFDESDTAAVELEAGKTVEVTEETTKITSAGNRLTILHRSVLIH